MKPIPSVKILDASQLAAFLEQLADIPFQGFFRFSADDSERYLDDQPLPTDLLAAPNGFLLEAELYQTGVQTISIRQLNDAWRCTTIAWNGLPESQADSTITELLTRSSRKLRCYTHYEPVPNGDFNVLQPAFTAFIGFTTTETKE